MKTLEELSKEWKAVGKGTGVEGAIIILVNKIIEDLRENGYV